MASLPLSRRALIAGLGTLPLLAALPKPLAAKVEPALEFDILRKGNTIGEHRIAAQHTAEGLRIDIETEIRVRALGLTVYRYEHHGREDWRGEEDRQRLIGLETRTDDNGKAFAVVGEASDRGFQVEGSEGAVLAPPDVVPASYWTPALLGRHELLNTKRGVIFPIEVESRGAEVVPSGGQEVEAAHYFIAGDPAVHIWFDEQQRVRRLAFESRGEFIDYRLRSMDLFGADERVF